MSHQYSAGPGWETVVGVPVATADPWIAISLLSMP